jgi:CRISPR-associated endonuclease/helicase Cas3
VPEQGGEPGEIKGRTRDIQISLPSILVNFPNSKEIKFRAIFGTNVYLIGARIQKYLYTLERKNEYWIC